MRDFKIFNFWFAELARDRYLPKRCFLNFFFRYNKIVLLDVSNTVGHIPVPPSHVLSEQVTHRFIQISSEKSPKTLKILNVFLLTNEVLVTVWIFQNLKYRIQLISGLNICHSFGSSTGYSVSVSVPGLEK